MFTLEEYRQEALKDEEVSKEYEDLQPEYDIIHAMINIRTTQNLTQKDLAEKAGISLSDIKKTGEWNQKPISEFVKEAGRRDGEDTKNRIYTKE